MKGRAISYSPEELAFIHGLREWPRSRAYDAFCQTFDRRDVSIGAFKGLCKRKGWLTGRTGCFVRGAVPANKGKKMPYNANSARTQFKAGQLPHNTRYLGHERVSKDGYVEISIAETNPHTGYERRYVLKHKHLWEQVNGPVPEGMFLKCLDSNRQNTDPSNWELMPRATLPYLTGFRGIDYDAAEPDVKPAILAVARLKHKARTIRSQKGGA